MKLIIDISEEDYKRCTVMASAIRSGIPLPKGHGRLIDADALNARMEQRMNEIGDDESIWESSNVATALDMFAPTIIEADKEAGE